MEKSRKNIVSEGLVKYNKQLLGFAISLTHNMEEAKDLTQETALHILNKTHVYEERGYFLAWAKRVMIYKFMNKRENESKHPTIDYDDIPASEAVYSVAESDCNIDYGNISRLVATLPPSQTTPFMLVADGYSYKEIANETGATLSSVKNCIHAARVTLRRRLSQA
ncbi:MAG: RNA polymerase sigma factor [Bacteroidaceae bacterium]|nr:RNA polymerase sigma factor [Bacteroidaceae bacterium]